MTAIDILLPFYGNVDYLKEAVDSVIHQSDPDWRLVVVDDAYPDPSVRSWFSGLSHPSIEYHRNMTNLGANANYQRVLDYANASHVVVMGADDIMLPNYVSTLRQALTFHPDVAVVQPGVEVIDENGAETLPLVDRMKDWFAPSLRGEESLILEGEHLAKSLLRGNWTYFPSLCWRRESMVAIGFRRDFNVVQDLALLLDVTAAGGSLLVLRETAFRYRRHTASDSATKTVSGSRFKEERAIFDAMQREAHQRGWFRAARAARCHLSSRLHAAANVPPSVGRRQWRTAQQLVMHTLAP